MNLKFKSSVRIIKGYPLITVPYNFCEVHKIKLGDHLIVKIKNQITHCLVSGTESSKRLNININLLKELRFTHKEKIILTVIKRSKKRYRKIKLCKFNNKLFLDLYYSLPLKQTHCKDELTVFKINKNKLLVCGKSASREIEIPRFIPLTDRTFEIFGLYQGEGSKKHQIGCAQVRFANSNLEIINQFLQYFEDTFKVSREIWTARIGCSRKIKSDRKLKSYWSKNTRISLENFIKTGFNKSKGTKAKKYGVLNIIIPSSILTEIIMSILEITRNLSLRNKNYAKAFLRGILAADAHVHLVKWPNKTTLSSVEIAVENHEEINLYKKLLEELSIESAAYPSMRKLNITHWNNLHKLAQMNAFILHPEKHRMFILGYNNHRKTISSLPIS